jgi:type II secretory pathway component GspD/PulD (secretin)
MKRAHTGRLLAVAFLLCMAAPPRAGAQQPPILRTQGGVVLNFQDVQLSYVISALAELASLNVVYSDLPEKMVTVRTPQPVALATIADMIRDLAATNGVAITEVDGYMRLQGAAAAQAIPTPRQLYILKLRHARAPILSQTLTTLFGGQVIQANTPQQAQTLSQQLRLAEQQAQLQAMRAEVARSQGQQVIVPTVRAGELEGEVTIVPDELTNSLLVRATPADYVIVQQAVQALDLRPLQVVIEVVIAEVRRTDDLNVGTSFVVESESGRTVGELVSDQPAQGGALGIIRSGVVDFEASIAALASTGDVRILSRPLVVAQNNQEAQIFVGSERPFVAFSQALPTDQGVLNQSIQYRDVGTNLTITPTINDEGYVNLALLQEVNAATNETQFDAPVISTRTAQTQILARHGQTVVVGGLVDRQEDRVRSGIPLLKDIPILGWLFGSERSTTGTAELFVFLTPYIVETDADADRVREEIENRAELLENVVPIVPLTPRVIRLPADTIRPPIPDTSAVRPRTTGAGQ